jgi:hypothetical protein
MLKYIFFSLEWSESSSVYFQDSIMGSKILSMPSFGRKVKPFAPCRRFAAYKRSLNGVKRRNFGKITGTISPTVPPFTTRSARGDGDVEASGGESGNV